MTKTQNAEKTQESKLEAPRFENGKAMTIAGLRGHFTTATWNGIPTQWQRLGSYGNVPGKVGAAHYGLCFEMANGVDYVCGVEVSGKPGLPAEFTSVNIPPQRYAVFVQRDHVSNLHQTMEAIGHWFPESGHEVAPPPAGAPNFFERYGPKFDPLTGYGDIEVWIPIKR